MLRAWVLRLLAKIGRESEVLCTPFYNEDAEDITTDPIEPTPPPAPGSPEFPRTGRNVGGLIISFGLLLVAGGAFLLRRAYRF